MTKTLNLDEIELGSDKQVVLKGVTHEFHPFTVADFITQVKEMQTIQSAETSDMADVAEFSIKTILRAFPTIAEADLRDLTMSKLTAISEFVREVAKAEAAPAADVVDTAGNELGAAS